MAQTVEQLLVRIDATTESLRREMRKADQSVDQATRKMDRDLARVDAAFARVDRAAGIATKGLAALGLAFGMSEVVQFGRQMLASAEEIGRTAQALGITTGAVQELNYAFSRFGLQPDDVADALNTLADRAQDAISGTKSMQEDFALLGITVDQLRGKRPDELFDLFADAVQRTTNVSERNAAVVRNLGDDLGRKLLPMLVAAEGGYRDLRQEARDLGLIIDDAVIANASRVRAEFDKASQIIGVQFMNALNEAAPILTWFADTLGKSARLWSDILGLDPVSNLREQMDDWAAERDRLLEVVQRGRDTMGKPLDPRFVDKAIARIQLLNDLITDAGVRIVELEDGRTVAPPPGRGGSGGAGALEALKLESLQDYRTEVATVVAGIGTLEEAQRAAAQVFADTRTPLEQFNAEMQRLETLYTTIDPTTGESFIGWETYARGVEKAKQALEDIKKTDIAERVQEQQRLNQALMQSAAAYERVRQEIERENAVRQFEAALVKAGFKDTANLVNAYEDEYRQLQQLQQAHEELLDQRQRGQEFAKQLGLTFSSAFEDAIVKMESLRDITNALLQDILRLIVRIQITQPMANAIGGIDWSGLFKGWFGGANANGNAFYAGRVIPHALGGVVTGPTFFPMARGIGLMGEAGPEAIMPLKRGTDGKLGVSAQGIGGTVVQIIDQRQTGTAPQVEQVRGPDGRQLIRVLIRDELQAAISSGALDRTMANTYGLRRRGV